MSSPEKVNKEPLLNFITYRNERSRKKLGKLSGGRFKKKHRELLFHTCIHKL